ncbi:heavy-metal-associated domain-containing protein [Flagellimonas myxillae]|uniref:heavy-metal-associated domain-containing protein n=1 Tax=Flagellimonas myxillae TaxID=2942214 RepID=UPI00201EB247|nr:metal transporter [Muricauda myxillae]MCL6266247.1 metal transporter [Muricauda myxillae]
MKKTVFLFFILLGLNLAHSQDKNKSVTFEVKGNCWMCKNRIEKTAIKMKGVKFASWNSESKVFKAIIDERKCTVADVQEKIASVGHDSGEYVAPEEVYQNLPTCCKYRDPATSEMDHGNHK